MIGGAAIGTFGASMWLPLPELVLTPASQRAMVITTGPLDVDNAGTEVEMIEPQLEVIN